MGRGERPDKENLISLPLGASLFKKILAVRAPAWLCHRRREAQDWGAVRTEVLLDPWELGEADRRQEGEAVGGPLVSASGH